MPSSLLPWTILAGTLYAFALLGLQMIDLMLLIHPKSQLQEFAILRSYPVWTALPLVLLGAVVAGVVEEAAFRGYMQAPIEKRHGPAIAIVLVAFFFAIGHFPPPAMIPILALGATGWGLLAYLTGSIIPGIVFHSIVDAAFWLWAWADPKSLEKLFTGNVHNGDFRTAFPAMVALTGLSAVGPDHDACAYRESVLLWPLWGSH